MKKTAMLKGIDTAESRRDSEMSVRCGERELTRPDPVINPFFLVMLATRASRQLGLVRNAKNAIPATPARVIARRRISSTPRRWADKDSNPLQQTELGARNKAAVGVSIQGIYAHCQLLMANPGLHSYSCYNICNHRTCAFLLLQIRKRAATREET
jgi:hypothetical protein